METKPNNQIFIELGGKTRELRFTWRTLDNLERVMNLQFSEMAIQLSGGTFGLLRTAQMMWAAFLHDSPNLTLIEVEDMMDTTKWKMYTDLLTEAFEMAFPPKKEDSEEKNEAGSKTSGLSKSTSEQATS